ncbi:ATP-binding protein [Amycolatopsis minnesotensis]|uniref:ATP-binding protein n=1 Tax=Amycolatopsis minnesotensis TaxID=337894 RepID=A0ABN2SJE4_9PSEU
MAGAEHDGSGKTATTGLVSRRSFAADLGELAGIRWWVREVVSGAFPGVAAGLLNDVVLVADELATSALRHGEPPFEIALDLSDSGVLVEIGDGDPDPVAPPSPEGGGSALAVVAAVSRRWGQRVDQHGKTVWAELDWPPPD